MSTSNTDNAESQARAQVSSIAEMVSALECDYERLEELRDKASAGHYVAGWNMPGYMPDSEPAAFETCDEARDYIADEMASYASQLHDACDELQTRGEHNRDERDAADNLQQTAQNLRDSIGDADADYGETIGKYHYWLTHIPGKLADADEQKELDELNEAAGECADADDARERIEQDALSVEVRSGWHSLGETLEPEEFRIVLCTGGPHVELVGELDEHCQPDRVRVIYKDWGSSGELFDFDRETVLTYCRVFYFGD